MYVWQSAMNVLKYSSHDLQENFYFIILPSKIVANSEPCFSLHITTFAIALWKYNGMYVAYSWWQLRNEFLATYYDTFEN